jgi:hypothetical protein
MVKSKSKKPPAGKSAKKKPMGRPSLSGQASAGERSPFVGIRLAPEELAQIDALAERHGLKRSELIRRLLEAGRKVMN